MPNPTIEQHLLGTDFQGEGLLGLVFEILNCEADFSKNTDGCQGLFISVIVQELFISIIVEELSGRGISEEIIFGRRV